jgi:hypothetical protein
VKQPPYLKKGLTNDVFGGCRPQGPVFKSKYVPDVCINPHPRFGTLVANIRSRRGSKVDIQVPLFQDTNTPEFRQHVAGGEGGHEKEDQQQSKTHESVVGIVLLM